MSRLEEVRIIEPPMDLPGFPLEDVPENRYIDMSDGLVDVFLNAKKLKSLCIGTRSSNCDPKAFRLVVRLLSLRGVYCSLETGDGYKVDVPDYMAF